MDCPSEDRLLEFVNHSLPAGDGEELREHLDACAGCRASVAAFVKLYKSTPGDEWTAATVPLKGKHALPETIGPFRVLGLLGAGGMGEVYHARDSRLGRDVAIKLLPARLRDDREWLLRFEREIRAIGRLNHPNLLTVYDVGMHEGSRYIVTEFLEGETLRSRLRTPMPVRRALEIARDLADGLAAAHDKEIVHRDVKPENVYVTTDGRVKLLDFGLAKDHKWSETEGEQQPTEPGVVLGTVGYMSPEQVRGRAADPRSDLFSLGVVTYEMLTGERPFRGASEVEVLNAILKEDPPALPTADHVVRRCLEKDPAARYASARELAADLQTALSGTRRRVMAPRWRPWLVRLATAVVLAGAGVAALRFWPRKSKAVAVQQPPREVVRRRITAVEGGGSASFAALAPDGKLAAYTDFRGQTHIVLVSTGQTRELPLPRDTWTLTWLPDGVELAALLCQEENPDCRLAQVSAFGGEAQELAVLPKGILATLGADRLLIAGGPKIWVATLRGDRPRILAELAASADVAHLAAAPGGRWISAYDAVNQEIILLDGEHGAVVARIAGPARLLGFAWTSDHRLIYAALRENVLTEVWAQTVDDAGHLAGKPAAIETFDGRVEIVGATADGRRIAYIQRDSRIKGYLSDASPSGLGPPRPLTSDVFVDLVQAFTPDGKDVLVQSTRSGQTVVVRVPVDGGPARELAEGERPSMSPDGASVMFMRRPADDQARWTFWSVPLIGGAPRLVCELPEVNPNVQIWITCQADERCHYVDGTSTWVRHRWLDRKTCTLEPISALPDGKQFASSPSPDGTMEARTVDRKRIEVIPLAGGTPSILGSETCVINRLQWTSDSRAVLASCMEQNQSPSYIIRWDLSGERRVLAETPFTATRMAISPDGARVAYTLYDHTGYLWVADGL